MSHDDPQPEPTPDFNELFKEELRLPQDPQAETPAERRRKLPPRLLPGHPERWDENAKYWAGLWLETLRDELSGSLRDAEQLAETCCEYARLCLLYGNAGEAIPLAKETLRRLAEQFGKDQLKAFNQIRRVYSRVFELAFGCRFHAEAIDFARFAIDLIVPKPGEPLPDFRHPCLWTRSWTWCIDLSYVLQAEKRIDEALRVLDDGAKTCEVFGRKWHRADIELRATLLAFHLVDQKEGLRRAKHLLQWSHGELDTSDLRQRALVLVEEFEVKESDEA